MIPMVESRSTTPLLLEPHRGLRFYAVVRTLVVAFSRSWWRLEVEGSEHLPLTGSYIVAPVHRSNADSLVVAALTKRRMRYMGKEGLWKYKLAGRFLSAMGGFPVRRGAAAREALRACSAVLESGEPLVVFPEGTRNRGPIVEHFFDGAALLASRNQVPVIPVGIGGTEDAMPRGRAGIRRVRVTVIAGPPIPPPASADSGRVPRSEIAAYTAELRDRVQELFDRAQVRSA